MLPIISDMRLQGEFVLRKLAGKDMLCPPLLGVAVSFALKGDYKNAITSFEQCLQLADDMSYSQIKAASNLGLGAVYLWTFNKARATTYYRRSREAFLNISAERQYGLGLALLGLGMIFHSEREWREVFRYYEDSIEQLGKDNSPEAVALKGEVKTMRDAALKEYRESLGDLNLTEPSIPAVSPTNIGIQAIGSMLEIFPVVGNVAAGSPLLALENIDFYVGAREILINGTPVFLRTLGRRTENFFRLAPGVSYFCLGVKGDSMVGIGICDGDYVFVQRQNGAEKAQIIVARIGNEATVKRYYPEKGQIRLEPENENERSIIIVKDDQKKEEVKDLYEKRNIESSIISESDFEILGVVVAVLKKKLETQ